ncbi:hypothetical protein F0562_000961 [Nyssa sinensis]|uniref:Uncharacterized protein n=1 Tax=Nyssa sinensis TaxID=561372 RepID=A0A5J5C5Z2_9ASTE|nr:hypothetical protein F0562_000961 [Nyssa sinensis]
MRLNTMTPTIHTGSLRRTVIHSIQQAYHQSIAVLHNQHPEYRRLAQPEFEYRCLAQPESEYRRLAQPVSEYRRLAQPAGDSLAGPSLQHSDPSPAPLEPHTELPTTTLTAAIPMGSHPMLT